MSWGIKLLVSNGVRRESTNMDRIFLCVRESSAVKRVKICKVIRTSYAELGGRCRDIFVWNAHAPTGDNSYYSKDRSYEKKSRTGILSIPLQVPHKNFVREL